MLSGGSGDGSSEGGFILKDYIGSWDEFKNIDRAFDLAKHYVLGDLISRYGGAMTGFRQSDISLWNYYRNAVSVKVDPKSGIAAIEVRAYRPEFAQRLAGRLLHDSVQHMNDMSVEQEQDYLASAQSKKASLEAAIRTDEAALAQNRATNGVYDPQQQYVSDLALVNSLSAQYAALKSQYSSIEKATPNSPEAGNVASAMAAVQARIAETKGHFGMLGRGSAAYEGLVAHRDNDLKLLEAASVAELEAHQRGIENRYYLEVISQPSQPTTPELPHRLWWIGGVFVATLLLWGLLR